MDNMEKMLFAAMKSAMHKCDDFWAEHYYRRLRRYQAREKVYVVERRAS